VYRGNVATTRFERDSLREYAEVFKTVSVASAYYDFPRRDNLKKLADAVPDDFRFGFKVTDVLTVEKVPNLARFGAKAGQPNPNFLNAELFATAFLKPYEEIRNKVGVLMFEFSRILAERLRTRARFCQRSRRISRQVAEGLALRD